MQALAGLFHSENVACLATLNAQEAVVPDSPRRLLHFHLNLRISSPFGVPQWLLHPPLLAPPLPTKLQQMKEKGKLVQWQKISSDS